MTGKRSQPNIRAYSSSLHVTFSPVDDGTEKMIPRRHRRWRAHHHWRGSPKRLYSRRQHECCNAPVALNSRSPSVSSSECSQVVVPPERPVNTRSRLGSLIFSTLLSWVLRASNWVVSSSPWILNKRDLQDPWSL